MTDEYTWRDFFYEISVFVSWAIASFASRFVWRGVWEITRRAARWREERRPEQSEEFG